MGTLTTAAPQVDPITRLPLLILFPHSRCNCRCLMCDIWRSDARDQLAPQSIAERLQEWQGLGVRRVLLSGGEALMHPRLWELCGQLRCGGIDLSLLSTGLLLRRHAEQIAGHCDEVIVSLDGPPSTHDAIRNVPRAYGRLAQGVQAVAAAAAARGVRISLSARCTVQKRNCGQLVETVRSARALGLVRLSFLAADVSSTAFNRPAGWDESRAAEVALNPQDLLRLSAELDRLEREHADDFASGFIAESPQKLRARLYQYYAALLGQGEFAPHRCNAPWVSAVIEADGTVRPCFFHAPIGRLQASSSLQSILNSPRALEWRRQLDVRRDPVCRRCVCTLSLQGETLTRVPHPS